MAGVKPAQRDDVLPGWRVTECARCGGTHESIDFMAFERPLLASTNESFDYWAMCPEKWEPILMRYTATAR